MKVFIVQGTTGEYSDRREWVSCAVRSEDHAQRIVSEYDRIAKEIEVRTTLEDSDPRYIDRYKQWDDNFEWPHPDPNFDLSYTGTLYRYTETELRE